MGRGLAFAGSGGVTAAEVHGRPPSPPEADRVGHHLQQSGRDGRSQMNRLGRSRRRVALCGCVVGTTLLTAEAVYAAPDEQQVTTTRFAIKYHMDNLSSGSKSEVLSSYVVVLSAGNKIKVAVHGEDTDHHVKLTEVPEVALGQGEWHVVDSHKLEQTRIYPQHIRKIEVAVSGNTCKASISWTLLPGYNQYIFPQLVDGHYAVFAKPMFLDSVCTIQTGAVPSP